jgi:hypothetical protein
MGGLVMSGVLLAVPLAAAAVVQALDVDTFGVYHSRLPGPWQSLLGVLLLVALALAVSALGRLAAVMAPVLLGPSPQEQIAALQRHRPWPTSRRWWIPPAGPACASRPRSRTG